MNIAITQGYDLMPPPFADGLAVWSSGDGTPGSPSYDGAANASIVAADQDFGGCLELLKTDSIQKLRWTGQTPLIPGVYLRIRARVKAVSGVFPDVRIAAFAADAAGNNVAALPQVGPSVTLTNYGEIVEVSAIVGTGNRPGVDMVWGMQASYGHFGLDLTGGSGGIVRIDDIVIEDITSAFLRDMMDMVDVRDYGAVGDGVTDDHAAFVAADTAAGGRVLVVPDGVFRIGSSLTLQSKVRFDGTLSMDDATRLILIRNFDLPTYVDAFGDEVLAFRKGFQALMNYADHDAFDLKGRRIDLDGPIDMQAAVADVDVFESPRTIRNGQIYAVDSTAWTPDVVTATATYNANNPKQLTNISNAAQIPPGALVTGNGVGREVYVTSVDVSGGTLTLSQALYGPATSQTYTFTRFKYALDFSGFASIRRLTLQNIEFQMRGIGSAVLLPRGGSNLAFKDCYFNKPKDRAITSSGRGCQGIHIDRCNFNSPDQGQPAVNRTSVGFNVNANDAKLRECEFQRFGMAGILYGNNHLIASNHIFQGDETPNAARTPGLVFTYEPTGSIINGNYIDNCYIEWTNEHDAAPDFGTEFSFTGMTITGNIFLTTDVLSSFQFIVIKPYGAGHSISHMQVNQNIFRAIKGNIDRVEGVDTSFASLNPWACRNLTFERNSFQGVNQPTSSPVTLEFQQNTAQKTWTLDVSGYLPFGGNARTVSAVVVEGDVLDSNGNVLADRPSVKVNQGAQNQYVQLVWPKACTGTVHVTARVDRPL
ncbi:MAG: right-handed parallel beta-helix repeat-containing protein [Alphaproteobacteria bacterium]|nr:MAG: right-handed parallel beta-helix repeat-containing protein [Alphaproteobacteria bacterium]